ncbi:MAG: GNAT family N-acetyltransferase [Clostridia bacterium]|nr:GNAT family N-acetyltransferase [Clostridia bacterium]
MDILRATPDDFEAVREITQTTIRTIYPHYYPAGAVALFCGHHSDERIRADIAAGNVFLLRAEGNAVGTVTLSGNEICRLYVLPREQHKGYGRALLDFAEKRVLARYESVRMDASFPAKQLYRKRGYRETEYHTLQTENGDWLCYDVMELRRQRDTADRFFLEVPGPARKDEAIAYIREFQAYGSAINGTGGLNRYLDDYEGWLRKLEADSTREPSEEKVPARTFFLVRESDSRIVGMINIRLTLNERLSRYGGHMGYSIRPTERGKGYNKINLYLGLKVCDQYGIRSVFLDADLDNPASWRTMEALGGVRIREYYDDQFAHCTVVDYTIDVRKALEEHTEFEHLIR